jgi:hypothetical protein
LEVSLGRKIPGSSPSHPPHPHQLDIFCPRLLKPPVSKVSQHFSRHQV